MDRPLTDLAISTIKVNDIMQRNKEAGIFEVYVFEQTWESTALGFGGIGGSAITTAWTHVVMTSDGKYHVFFNGRHAYSIENPTDKFKSDLANHYMLSVQAAQEKYYL